MSKNYIITKTINNNVSFSKDEHGNEIIIFGKGISFGKKAGDSVDKSLVIKTFKAKQDSKLEMYVQAIENIDFIYIDIASRIVKLYEESFKCTLKPVLIISLADHLYNAVDNAKKGIHTPSSMLVEIKRIYPNEFKVACQCLQLIKDELEVEFTENEAGFIVMHYLNSISHNEDISKKINLINKICTIIESYFEIELNKSSFKYDRFITHLSFLVSRLFFGAEEEFHDDFIYRVLRIQYPEINKCVELVSEFLAQDYNKKMSSEEKGYLIVHINGLLTTVKKG